MSDPSDPGKPDRSDPEDESSSAEPSWARQTTELDAVELDVATLEAAAPASVMHSWIGFGPIAVPAR